MRPLVFGFNRDRAALSLHRESHQVTQHRHDTGQSSVSLRVSELQGQREEEEEEELQEEEQEEVEEEVEEESTRVGV
ncbi:hypothetical protein AAFF_G00075090 [Aldrovandia affinis]|uniref:Uncharacterized protein n=1 Tax=Aldrovandia affinis TaxID=143900 RepID=A0AAD7WDW9_9TELE|nr:hypothetical protein AAFF_G00075090 [Aldrovandia affinis]